jgi:hypothetical protein
LYTVEAGHFPVVPSASRSPHTTYHKKTGMCIFQVWMKKSNTKWQGITALTRLSNEEKPSYDLSSMWKSIAESRIDSLWKKV